MFDIPATIVFIHVILVSQWHYKSQKARCLCGFSALCLLFKPDKFTLYLKLIYSILAVNYLTNKTKKRGCFSTAPSVSEIKHNRFYYLRNYFKVQAAT